MVTPFPRRQSSVFGREEIEVMRVVLASASPRRSALLGALGLTFEVIPSRAPEVFEGIPSEIVVQNARAKRDDVAAGIGFDALIIAADTLVFLDEHVLGKPRDLDEASRMLHRLSGRTHQVITGLALFNSLTGKAVDGFECTDVTFRHLSSEEIARFVEAVNPIDRAGAYTVDGPGSLLVERYHGCYQNVLGLPMVRLDCLCREAGLSLFDCVDGRRAVFL